MTQICGSTFISTAYTIDLFLVKAAWSAQDTVSVWSTLQTWIVWWMQKAFYKDLAPALGHTYATWSSIWEIVTIVSHKAIICDGSTAGPVLNMQTARVDVPMYQFSSAWQGSLAHCLRHLPVRPMYTLELSTQRNGLYTIPLHSSTGTGSFEGTSICCRAEHYLHPQGFRMRPIASERSMIG